MLDQDHELRHSFRPDLNLSFHEKSICLDSCVGAAFGVSLQLLHFALKQFLDLSCALR